MKRIPAGLALLAILLASTAACKKGLTTPSGGTIVFRGIITQNGQRVAGVTVYLSWDASRAVQTDGNGAFAFDNPAGSGFFVTPSQLGARFSPSNVQLGGESRTDLDFQIVAPAYGSKVGDMAADFSLVNQGGTPVSLAQFHGSVLLVNFSADWCGPCRTEAARLQALFDEYKDRGLVILTLLIDGSPAVWAAQFGLKFPVLNDNARGQWRIYGEGSVPLNLILDRNLTIRYKAAGFNETTIVREIKKYL